MSTKSGKLLKSSHGLLGEKWSEKWVCVDATRLLYSTLPNPVGQTSPSRLSKLGITTSNSPTSRFFSFTAPSSPSTVPNRRELLLEQYTLGCRNHVVSPIQRKAKQPRRFVFTLVPKEHSQKTYSFACDTVEELDEWICVLQRNGMNIEPPNSPSKEGPDTSLEAPQVLDAVNRLSQAWSDWQVEDNPHAGLKEFFLHELEGSALVREFEHIATNLSRRLIRLIYYNKIKTPLSPEYEEISDSSPDGETSLTVYSCHGITFFLPKSDTACMDDDTVAKDGGMEEIYKLFDSEIRMASHLILSQENLGRSKDSIDVLSIPLQCVVDWMGYRVYTRATFTSFMEELPGKDIFSRKINLKKSQTRRTAQLLPMKNHELMVHLLNPQILCFARTCTFLEVNAYIKSRYHLRPELIHRLDFLFSPKLSDAHVGKTKRFYASVLDCAYDAAKCQLHAVLPAFIHRLEFEVSSGRVHDSQTLENVLHQYGFNMHWLGYCYAVCTTRVTQRLLLTEMLARACKIPFREGLRDFVVECKKQQAQLEGEYDLMPKEALHSFYNIFLRLASNMDDESQLFWENRVIPVLRDKFHLKSSAITLDDIWKSSIVHIPQLLATIHFHLQDVSSKVKSLYQATISRDFNEGRSSLESKFWNVKRKLLLLETRGDSAYRYQNIRANLMLDGFRLSEALGLATDDPSKKKWYKMMSMQFFNIANAESPKWCHAYNKACSVASLEIQELIELGKEKDYGKHDGSPDNTETPADDEIKKQMETALSTYADAQANCTFWLGTSCLERSQLEYIFARIFIRLNDSSRASHHLDCGIRTIQEAFGHDCIMYARCRHYQGVLLSHSHFDLESIVNAFESASKLYQRNPLCKFSTIDTLHRLAKVLEREGNREKSSALQVKAYLFAKKSYSLSKCESDIRYRLRTCIHVARLAQTLGYSHESIAYHQKALKIMFKFGDKQRQSDWATSWIILTADVFQEIFHVLSFKHQKVLRWIQTGAVIRLEEYFQDLKLDFNSKLLHFSAEMRLLTWTITLLMKLQKSTGLLAHIQGLAELATEEYMALQSSRAQLNLNSGHTKEPIDIEPAQIMDEKCVSVCPITRVEMLKQELRQHSIAISNTENINRRDISLNWTKSDGTFTGVAQFAAMFYLLRGVNLCNPV